MNIESVRSQHDLLHAITNGLRPKYVFFWGHQPLPDGRIGRNCFSQWFPAPFSVEGLMYPTAEHFMMAEKAILFGDTETRDRILEAPHPDVAKRLGRGVRNFDEGEWERVRFALVMRGNLAKFGQNPGLAEFLLNTGNRVLVEASPVDQIWGIGLAADDSHAEDPGKWKGLNLLGFALMEVRGMLRGEKPGL